jgi:hypothetical protein
MKKFLLIVGQDYYPQSGTEDWIGCFETYEEAKSKIHTTEEHEYFTKGPRKGQVKSTRIKLWLDKSPVGWYEIVDLEEWMNK